MSSQKQEETMAYSQFSIPVLIAPNLLSVFHKGIDESVGNKVDISPLRLTDFQETSQRRNPFLSLFSDMDISGIVKILSLFTLILSAGLISRERENNTYKLVFANSIKKSVYYLSKYCATGISALLSLTVLFLSILILILVNPMIQLSGIFWMKLFTLFLTSFLYLSVFILLGLLLSSCSENAGSSVLWSVLLWITISFVYPNLVSTFVNKPMDAEIRNMSREIKRIEDNGFSEFSSLSLNLKPFMGMIHVPMNAYFDQNIQEQRLLTRLNTQDFTLMAFISMSEKYILENNRIKWENLFPIYFQYQQDICAQRDILHQKQLEQQDINHLFTCFLPDILYEQAVSSLSGTNISYRDKYIQDELKMYRNRVFDYLNSQRAFSEKFYTQLPEELWKDNWDDYPTNIKEIYSGKDTYPKISYKDAPLFILKKKNEFPLELLFITGMNLLLFFVGLGIFQNVKQ
jgi:ABC-type transport system involved in multi-copper enzyme maturation permease subunit